MCGDHLQRLDPPRLRSRRMRGIAPCLWVLLCVSQVPGCGGAAKSAKQTGGEPPRRAAATAADTVPPPHLKVDLADPEKAALAAQAKEDLAQTAALIGKIDRQQLVAESLEKLKTVESLMAAAQSAGEKDDVAAMANLARKARLLSGELLPR